MLKTAKLDPTTCARCKGSISLVQINGKTLAVEGQAAYLGKALVILEIHRCQETPPADPVPVAPITRRKQVI